jgi:hypothetical protein
MKTTSAIAMTSIALTLLIAACSGSDLSGGSPPTATWNEVVKTRVARMSDQSTPTPIPTSTPFFRRTPAEVATAGPSATPEPTFTPAPTETPNPLGAELSPVMLSVEDLPTGWKVSQAALEVELTRFDDVCGVLIQDPAVADLAASYEASLSGPFASQTLSLYDGPANAAAVLSQLQTAYAACPETGYSYADGSWLVIAPISFPTIGEESFGLRLTVGQGEFAIEADMIVFRIDEVLSVVTYADLGDLFGGGASSHLETLVRSAEAKIHALADHIDAIEVPIQAV